MAGNLNQIGEPDTAQVEFRGYVYESTPLVGYGLVEEKVGGRGVGWRHMAPGIACGIVLERISFLSWLKMSAE